MTRVRPGARPPVGTALLFAVLCLALLLLLSGGPGAAALQTTATNESGNLTVYHAPDTDLGSAAEIRAAIENGTIEPAERVVVGETLVVAIDSERLAADMTDREGSTTERFLAVLDGDADLRLVQTNPTPQREILVTAAGRGNVTALRDRSTTYALVETGELTFRYRTSGGTERIFGGERFAVQFGYDLGPAPRSRDWPRDRVVELHPFESEFETLGRWYEPLPPEWVELTVDVGRAPEESLVARVRLDGNRTLTAPVEVDDPPGTERVWLNLRGVEPGTNYTLELVHDGEVTDRYAGTVREPRAGLSNATLTEVGTELVVTRDGERVTERIDDHAAVNVTVRLSHGGKVQVLDGTCEPLGTEWVDPGNETRLTVRLWDGGRPIRDAGGEYDLLVRTLRHRRASRVRYPGSEATAALGFGGPCSLPERPSTPTPPATVETPQPTPPPSTAPPTPTVTPTTVETPQPTAVPTTPAGGPEPTDSATASDTGTARDGGTGFTAATLLVASVALALLGRRRS